ncbi:MAG: PDDEXK nuclease domain-containing protein [Elusimicrobia bacterium]|nr:PDDEXK nuclease domain-containing protein [Candidatus Liberimonas magnetica]
MYFYEYEGRGFVCLINQKLKENSWFIQGGNKENMKKLIKSDYITFLKGIITEVRKSQYKAYQSVNRYTVELYWSIGKQLHDKIEIAKWGDGVIDILSTDLKKTFPNMSGFNRRNLYRMIQFYKTYSDNAFVSEALTQINWTNNLLIISKSDTSQERDFYINMCIKERWSSPELERQMNNHLFEKWSCSGKNNRIIPHSGETEPSSHFRDEYNLAFLGLKEPFDEKDLRKAIVHNLRDFFLEFGKHLAFVGEEYPVTIGNRDFKVDLLFYHRVMQRLIAVELKISKFVPEYIGKMQFYLNALDKNIKLEHENPSVGLILCKTKNDEVVKVAVGSLNKSMKVATYEIIDQKLLEHKMHSLPCLENKTEIK